MPFFLAMLVKISSASDRRPRIISHRADSGTILHQKNTTYVNARVYSALVIRLEVQINGTVIAVICHDQCLDLFIQTSS